MERWLSGLKQHPAKVLSSQGLREFESLPLRKQFAETNYIVIKSVCRIPKTTFILRFEPERGQDNRSFPVVDDLKPHVLKEQLK